MPSDSTSSRGNLLKGLSLKEQYIAQRARGAYIASVCQLEAAQTNKNRLFDTAQNDRINKLNRRIQWQLDNPDRGLRFKPLNLESVKLVVYTDASHANNSDLSSQIGYVIVMVNKFNNANLLH